ncbi:hypothetical protein Gohar_001297, partial [Gossypium harknessii]|nr:hypothetical protein [Gossypium harknessii]
MVVTKDAMWNSYISSHKAAGQFRHHSFSYYDQPTDIVKEIDVEDVATANNLEEGNNYHECENDVSLD